MNPIATTNRTALITGASSGIGKATALAFAKAGINLALLGRSEDKLMAVAAAATTLGVTAKTYVVDLAQIDRVAIEIAAIAADFDNLDILINNAGMAYTGAIADTPLADWQRIIDLNLTSVFQCIQGILPQMRQRQSGIIVNVSSIASKQVFPNWGAYSVSKFGLMALTKAIAGEERANGIRVSAVCPGSVDTPLWDTDTVQADFDRSAMLTAEAVAQGILYAVLAPGGAVVEELIIMPSGGAL
ncbi:MULTISPECIES: SDR family oxidoreductase [unclassified Chamaesiphon]|uniref:SDR family oxidoreductase n=1 Tax=unclassified Chamaesiphon TaxID=2620921 RepID=UPI00286C4DBF|nr:MULTISPECIES: SDR family oxidoreductase [unclassified Chamaesiphon]